MADASSLENCQSEMVREFESHLFRMTEAIEAFEDDLELRTADFFLATKGRFTISIGWLPERDPSGQFYCKVFLDGDAAHPMEELNTANADTMASWAVRQMSEIARRT